MKNSAIVLIVILSLGDCRTIRAEAKIRKFETNFWLV